MANRLRLFLLGALALGLAGIGHSAWAQSGHVHGALSGGQPGDPAQARRVIGIVARDNEFAPKSVRVAAGETVRFIVRNKGELLHEFTIGDAKQQADHQAEMARLLDSGAITTTGVDRRRLTQGHSHGNSVLIEPGKAAELVWKFANDGVIEFGCNIPGHYQSGMKGDFTFQ